MNDLFNNTRLNIGQDAWLLSGDALPNIDAIWRDMQTVIAAAPPAVMQVPSGHKMSVRTTSCGALGWVSDSAGYRYAKLNPRSLAPWPAMPASLSTLACNAASACGYAGFEPDSCLIENQWGQTRLIFHFFINLHSNTVTLDQTLSNI